MIRHISTFVLTSVCLSLTAQVLPAPSASTAPVPASPLQVAAQYQAALATLSFASLQSLLTKWEYRDEFKEDERDSKRAFKTSPKPHHLAEWEEDLADAKAEAENLVLIGEQIQGDRAIVTCYEKDDAELGFILLKRKNESAPWKIHETQEDDRGDATRFLKVPIKPELLVLPTQK